MSPRGIIRADRGTSLSCRSWPQEAALRMLMNNLDPEVAERPDELVVYGGTGKAARSWGAFDRMHFGGSLRGRWVLTAGLGGMGGAQPLAITLNEGVALCVEVDPERIERRLKTRYLDSAVEDLDAALREVDAACQRGEARS